MQKFQPTFDTDMGTTLDVLESLNWSSFDYAFLNLNFCDEKSEKTLTQTSPIDQKISEISLKQEIEKGTIRETISKLSHKSERNKSKNALLKKFAENFLLDNFQIVILTGRNLMLLGDIKGYTSRFDALNQRGFLISKRLSLVGESNSDKLAFTSPIYVTVMTKTLRKYQVIILPLICKNARHKVGKILGRTSKLTKNFTGGIIVGGWNYHSFFHKGKYCDDFNFYKCMVSPLIIDPRYECNQIVFATHSAETPKTPRRFDCLPDEVQCVEKIWLYGRVSFPNEYFDPTPFKRPSGYPEYQPSDLETDQERNTRYNWVNQTVNAVNIRGEYRMVHFGPRGGIYYMSASGNKVYSLPNKALVCIPRSSTAQCIGDPVLRTDICFQRIGDPADDSESDYVRISKSMTTDSKKSNVLKPLGKPMLWIRGKLRDIHQGPRGGIYYLSDQQNKVYLTTNKSMLEKIKYFVDSVEFRSNKYHYVFAEIIEGKKKFYSVFLDKNGRKYWKYIDKKIIVSKMIEEVQQWTLPTESSKKK